MNQAITPSKDPVRTWKSEDRVCDAASIEMLNKAAVDCVDTCYGRMDTQRNQCTFGKNGVCCRLCYMGPCRITPKAPRGVCGADADTIVARNYVREVASGTAAHSDHRAGRESQKRPRAGEGRA